MMEKKSAKLIKDYSLILSYGTDLTDEEITIQIDLIKSFLEEAENLEIHELGWRNLVLKIRNKAKKWVKKAKFYKLNFNSLPKLVDLLPLKIKNLDIEPLRFMILNRDSEKDLNEILD